MRRPSIVHALVKALLQLISTLRASSAKERLDALERAGGCVSCGSQRVVIEGESISCEECGYEGRADRGGRVTLHAIQSVYDDQSSAAPDKVNTVKL